MKEKSTVSLPRKRQLENYNLGMKVFFHFGTNTFTNQEWGDGTASPILFNPKKCDCRQWLSVIKDAGFKLAIITAKHHDGFCLWQTNTTEYSIKNSSYKGSKGDIVKEFTEACKEYGIKAGIYLSPWDRNCKFWSSSEYNSFYNEQLTELLTGYGEIFEIWWDGAGSKDVSYDWSLWSKTIRTLQPNACIFGSRGAAPFVDLRWVGNENGIAGNPCYCSVDFDSISEEDVVKLNKGDFYGNVFAPAEVDVSIRPGWFYHSSQNDEVKSPDKIVDLWFNSVGSNCTLLLNVPPDKDGLINKADEHNLKAANEKIKNIFDRNLLKEASVTLNGKNIKTTVTESIYSKNKKGLTLDCDLPALVEFKTKKAVSANVFAVSEDLTAGQKIFGYRVEALLNNKYVTIIDNKCVGNLWAETFKTVQSNSFRLVLYGAVGKPVLNHIGLYFMDESSNTTGLNKEKRDENLVKAVKDLDGYNTADFGGIYSFNTIKLILDKPDKYEIEIFNGASWCFLASGETQKNEVVYQSETPLESYQIRAKTAQNSNKIVKIEVFNKDLS